MARSSPAKAPRFFALAFVALVALYTIFLQWHSLLSILVFPVIVLLGNVGLVLTVADTFNTRSWRSLRYSLLMLSVASLWYVLPTNYIGAYVRARVESSGYQDVIRKVQAGAKASCDDRIYHCDVDPGPPVRVAFVWGGITDNWVGVIYDPDDVIQDVAKH